MKNILIIALLFVSFASIGQTLRSRDWTIKTFGYQSYNINNNDTLDYSNGLNEATYVYGIANLGGTTMTLRFATGKFESNGVALTSMTITSYTVFVVKMLSATRAEIISVYTPSAAVYSPLSTSSTVGTSSIAAGSFASYTVTLTGLTVGQAVKVGINLSATEILDANISWAVTAANTVTIKVRNENGLNPLVMTGKVITVTN
jgi:hypothetical protein